MYAFFKHLHVACVILSGTGFLVRGLLELRGVPLRRRWLRIAPHVNDTILLAAALVLVVLTGQYPFVADWVTAKIFGLIAYIILGSMVIKAGRTRGQRIAALLGAMAAFGYVVTVALTKSPWGPLRLFGG